MEGRMDGWTLNIMMSFVSQAYLFVGEKGNSGLICDWILPLEGWCCFLYLYIVLSELMRRKMQKFTFGRESWLRQLWSSSVYLHWIMQDPYFCYWPDEVKVWLRTNDPLMTTMFWCVFWLLFTGFSTCITLHFMLIIIASMDNTVDLHWWLHGYLYRYLNHLLIFVVKIKVVVERLVDFTMCFIRCYVTEHQGECWA